jgi:hypothetical protein
MRVIGKGVKERIRKESELIRYMKIYVCTTLHFIRPTGILLCFCYFYLPLYLYTNSITLAGAPNHPLC